MKKYIVEYKTIAYFEVEVNLIHFLVSELLEKVLLYLLVDLLAWKMNLICDDLEIPLKKNKTLKNSKISIQKKTIL